MAFLRSSLSGSKLFTWATHFQILKSAQVLLLISQKLTPAPLEYEKRFLFKGNSCFPISPVNKENKSKVSSGDQLRVIMDILGK